MILIALETSSKFGSIALFRDEQLLEEQTLPRTDGTAKTLAPALDELLGRHSISPSRLDLIAVTSGPGSFTGLRIGIVTAKFLAYASKAEVIGVNTLYAIAQQSPLEANRATAMLDAQRNQLFVAEFRREDNWFNPAVETHIVDRDSWMDNLNVNSTLIGPILEKLTSKIPDNVPVAPQQSWELRASSVGKLGLHLYQNGHRDDYWRLVPNYYRLSAAEEKAKKIDAEKQGQARN
jgi:tRNA threonylcarbamoyladenosine biosynthesis protein TsaB